MCYCWQLVLSSVLPYKYKMFAYGAKSPVEPVTTVRCMYSCPHAHCHASDSTLSATKRLMRSLPRLIMSVSRLQFHRAAYFHSVIQPLALFGCALNKL